MGAFLRAFFWLYISISCADCGECPYFVSFFLNLLFHRCYWSRIIIVFVFVCGNCLMFVAWRSWRVLELKPITRNIQICFIIMPAQSTGDRSAQDFSAALLVRHFDRCLCRCCRHHRIKVATKTAMRRRLQMKWMGIERKRDRESGRM